MKTSKTSTARVLRTCLNSTLATTFFEYSSLRTHPDLLSEPLALTHAALFSPWRPPFLHYHPAVGVGLNSCHLFLLCWDSSPLTTPLPRPMALRRLRALGHVAAVVHSEYEGAMMGRGRGGGCQWTAVTAKKEEVSEIEANTDGRTITCRVAASALRARSPDRRSGYVVKELYSKNVVPKVGLRQVSRTRAVEAVRIFMWENPRSSCDPSRA